VNLSRCCTVYKNKKPAYVFPFVSTYTKVFRRSRCFEQILWILSLVNCQSDTYIALCVQFIETGSNTARYIQCTVDCTLSTKMLFSFYALLIRYIYALHVQYSHGMFAMPCLLFHHAYIISIILFIFLTVRRDRRRGWEQIG
jgi:hypothetical protein